MAFLSNLRTLAECVALHGSHQIFRRANVEIRLSETEMASTRMPASIAACTTSPMLTSEIAAAVCL